jgi:hypothetical protein
VGAKATLIMSQLAVKAWHAWLEDPTVADAILDRIVHSSHRVALKGASLRKPEGQDHGLRIDRSSYAALSRLPAHRSAALERLRQKVWPRKREISQHPSRLPRRW